MYDLQTSTSTRVTPGRHIRNLAAATTLTGIERHVNGTANTASDDWTLSLAPASLWAGKFLYIHATIANSKTITVDVDGGSPLGWSDLTLDTDDDHVLLYSTGERILTAINGIA